MNTPLEVIKSFLDYCPETGVFTWKKSPNHRIKVGSEAGTVDKDGYRIIRLLGEFFKAHRLAIFYMTGVTPSGVVDHYNRDVSDNRYSNLSEVSHEQSAKNRKTRADNKSGHTGIFTTKHHPHKWTVMVSVDGKQKRVGRYDCLEKAISVRDLWHSQSGYHPNHGRIPCDKPL